MLISDLDIKPTGEKVERNYLRENLSPLPFVRGIKSVEVSFKTELTGTGSAGVWPTVGWPGILLAACGMGGVGVEGTAISYKPKSSSFGSVTLYVYKDGIFHKVVGCRGSVKLSIEVGKYIVAEWKFSGLYASPTDTSPGSTTFISVIPPVVLAADLTIGSYAAVATKVEIDMNVSVAQRKSMNADSGIVGWEVTGRSPQGSFDPEAVLEATHPFWGNWEDAVSAALSLTIGATAGNIIEITAPAIQALDQVYGDRDGILTYSVPFALAGNDGDDEIEIVFK
jgi:hypothetical protein